MSDDRLAQIMPEVYYTEEDPARGVYLIAMEYFDSASFSNLSVMGSKYWTQGMRFKVIMLIIIIILSFDIASFPYKHAQRRITFHCQVVRGLGRVTVAPPSVLYYLVTAL